jgi:four helix bundle protein
MSFQDLRVYQAASHLRHEVDKLAKLVSPKFAAVFAHLDEAVDSILLNIAEGSDSIYPNRRRNFYDIALGSAKEARAVLSTLDKRGAFKGASVFRPIVLALTITKMLKAMIDALPND